MSSYPKSVPEKSEIDATRLKQERAEDEVRAIQAAMLANSIRALIRGNSSKVRVITDNGNVNVFKDREVVIISLDKTGQYSLLHQKKGGGAIQGGVPTKVMTHANMMDRVAEWLRR